MSLDFGFVLHEILYCLWILEAHRNATPFEKRALEFGTWN